jgi:hypothetical protein
MSLLSQQRCANHATREAVARCPECREYYCRECVTEHDDRVICAACLKKLMKGPEARRWRLAGVIRAGQLGAGILTVWLCFYVAGRSMLSLETYFHENTLWKTEQPDTPEAEEP